MQHVRCAVLLLLLPCIALAQTRPDSMTVQIDTQQLSAKQAKKLRNNAYEKPVTKRPFFEKRIYANAFVGAAFLSDVISYPAEILTGGSFLVSNPTIGMFSTSTSALAGIGGFANLNIAENNHRLWTVRYGLGVDYYNYTKAIFNRYTGNVEFSNIIVDTPGIVHSGAVITKFGGFNTHLFHPYLTAMPILYKKNAAGQKTWNIGVGFRAGPVLETSDINTTVSTTVMSNPSNPMLMQYSLTGQIGWKYLALFYHYRNGSSSTPNYHTVGIRVGY